MGSKKQKLSKGKPTKSKGKYCAYHISTTHNTEECTALKKLKNKKDGAGKPNTWEKKVHYPGFLLIFPGVPVRVPHGTRT